jgi:hypothetical protein
MSIFASHPLTMNFSLIHLMCNKWEVSMNKQKGTIFALLVTSLIVVTPLVKAQETTQSEREELYLRYMRFRSYIKGGIIEPHWMEDGNSFWFAECSPENTVIYLVDPTANKKTELFETVRLRKAIADVLGHEPPYKGVPFSDFIFLKGEKAIEFNIEDKDFILELNNYSISEAPKPSAREKRLWGPKGNEVLSPDGRWVATIKNHNLWLRSTADGNELQITGDGIKIMSGHFDIVLYGHQTALNWLLGKWID